uniref:Acetylserotonin O-methyltransferase n=1 Tax=Nothobranchius furzeri TaxID=105023 RepID=A0A8C6NMF4_NOTFU
NCKIFQYNFSCFHFCSKTLQRRKKEDFQMDHMVLLIISVCPGCTGALAKHFTSAYPECNVTIFDLPKVACTARQHFVNEADQRIRFHEGDFFKDPLPAADLYMLARILHDWTDERCIELLSRIYKACKPGGSVLLVEALLNEDGSGPLTVQLYSLNMLVQAEGRERTAAQYTTLLAGAGFTNIQHRLTGRLYDVVLGHKDEAK